MYIQAPQFRTWEIKGDSVTRVSVACHCPAQGYALLPKAYSLRERDTGKVTLQDLGPNCHPAKERFINTIHQNPAFLVPSPREREQSVMYLCFHVAQLVMGLGDTII